MAQVKPLGGEKPLKQTVKYYPNPAVNFLVFEYEENPPANSSVLVFNFLGKKVIEAPLRLSKTTVSLADLYRGMYIFQVRDAAGKILDSGKFQISR